MNVVERYVLLGLRLGRHVEGLVDAYYGPPELAAEVESEPLQGVDQLAAEGESLLAAVAAADELEPGRRAWLGDQVRGLRTYAGVLAGETIGYADEVEGCYGVRPEPIDEAPYRQAHEQLDELLPGEGSLLERYASWRAADAVPSDRIADCIRDVTAVLRETTWALVDLPAGEELVVEEVRDEPWWAFNYYLGGLRSRVVVNVDELTTGRDVLMLAAHECYPGHHTEHALKEAGLVRDRGLLEESILLVPVPQALVSEGIAENALDLVLDDALSERLSDVLSAHAVDTDLELAQKVEDARALLRRVGLDAALLVHEEGASSEAAQAHVERWALRLPEQSAQTVRFVTDPTWRAYAITYSAGGVLCGAYVDGDRSRFVRLLTEQVRVADLVASVSSAP